MPPSITITGRTTRSFYRQISNSISIGNIPHMTPYSAITDRNTKREIRSIARNLLWSISGGQPMQLFSDMYDRDYKMQIEPLNTVCYEALYYTA